ncbi:hypothetical protein EDB19DRAFT_1835776 [Suillus lakei]|nr:hypothetical protein EDB19DRAFT_1835776 [Suillus lakei]
MTLPHGDENDDNNNEESWAVDHSEPKSTELSPEQELETCPSYVLSVLSNPTDIVQCFPHLFPCYPLKPEDLNLWTHFPAPWTWYYTFGPAVLTLGLELFPTAFFKPTVIFQYHDMQPCHFFTCAAPTCKLCAGGVHQFQDSKDKSSTANLKHHIVHCFGEDAVNAAISAGRPNVTLPSNQTISHDINTSFEKCQVCIAKSLQTAHIEYEGIMLTFLLDIVDVPETMKLDQLPNLFTKENCAHCFNHMLQLSTKTLLQPFNTALSGKDDNNNTLENLEDDKGQSEEDEQGKDKSDDQDDEIDELQELDKVEQARLLEDTAAICDTVTKTYKKQLFSSLKIQQALLL